MQLGMVGLGKMGRGLAARLHGGGHGVVGFDPDPKASAPVSDQGIATVPSLKGLVERLDTPVTIWLMVPAGAALDQAIDALIPLIDSGSILVDGGNSNYRETMKRHDRLGREGIGFLDVGTSGGVWGADSGYCLMVGGDPDTVRKVRPLLETLAPAPDQGWGHVGPAGAGHYVKMIHNGIEYGMMQAYAEGFALLDRRREFDLDLAEIAGIWNRGSVVRSWLLELAEHALAVDPQLENVRSAVADSGEGRWTVAEALDLDVAAPVITMALLARLQSRDPEAFSNRLLSALRREFGGHAADAEPE